MKSDLYHYYFKKSLIVYGGSTYLYTITFNLQIFIMKKTFILTLLLAFSMLNLSAQWSYTTTVGNPDPQARSEIASFPSGQVGFVAGAEGGFQTVALHKTLDGGMSWTELTIPGGGFSIRDIQFLSDQVGFLAGHTTGVFLPDLYKTTDGGSSWMDITPDSANGQGGYEVVDFMDADNGWFATQGEFFKTTDGGANWTEYDFTVSFNSVYPMDIDFVDLNHGSVACWDGTFFYTQMVYTTTDGGANWDVDSLGSMADWEFHIERPTQDLAFAYGGGASWQTGPRFYKSTNAGVSWDTITIPFIIDSMTAITSLEFQDSDTGYATTRGGHILKTEDAGQNWALAHTDTTYLYDLSLAAGAVYAVGDHGVCIKQSLSTNRVAPKPAPEFALYPNPVAEQVHIGLPASAGTALVTVRDLAGRLIAQQEMRGGQAIEFDVRLWGAGMYMVTLQGTDWLVTEKVVVH